MKRWHASAMGTHVRNKRMTLKAHLRLIAVFMVCLTAAHAFAQQLSEAAVIRMVDAAVKNRVENVLGFTDIEHYSVYRGHDETHPAAEMTARDNYTKGAGKTYAILAQSGSGVVQKFGLKPLIENEERINKPGNVEQSWFTSANYDMKLKSPRPVQMNGRSCYVLAITPKRKAPQMVDGTLWVDAKDGSIVQVEGVASKSPSPFAGTTHMMRQYANIEGYAMATHARAESKSALFGRTVVTIDYGNYQLQLRSGTSSTRP